eukprot:s202_g14.t1
MVSGKVFVVKRQQTPPDTDRGRLVALHPGVHGAHVAAMLGALWNRVEDRSGPQNGTTIDAKNPSRGIVIAINGSSILLDSCIKLRNCRISKLYWKILELCIAM